MKIKNLLGLAMALMCLIACKKENPVKEPTEPPTVQKPDPLELLKDSISYIIDGNQMIQMESINKGLINAEPNKKLDSLVKQKEYTSGDRDSVMFGRFFKFSDQNRSGITISFLKKYHKNQAQPANNQTSLFMPVNKLELFTVGERKFALDFQRNNSQNGIVLELQGDNYGFQTNGYPSLVYHALLKPELQSQSKFEITNLQKLKSGKYILEAKFNASVYWGDGTHPRKIDNGYIRIKINPESIYF